MTTHPGESPREYDANLRRLAQEAFSHHQIRERGSGRWTIASRSKENPAQWQWCCWAEIIVLRGGKLLVHGDIEHVLFAQYTDSSDPEAVLRWMGKHTDLGYYVHQKAKIGTGQQLVDRRDGRVLLWELHDRITERTKELAEELVPQGGCDWGEIDDIGSLRSWDDEDLGSLAEEFAPRARQHELVLPGNSRDETLATLGTLRDKLRAVDMARVVAEDAQIEAYEEAIDILDSGDDEGAIRSLYEARTKDGEDNAFGDCESLCGLGIVIDARVYYAHAALRRLCQLLDEEAMKAQASPSLQGGAS